MRIHVEKDSGIQTNGIRNLLNKSNYCAKILWGKTQISSVGSDC
jgi:hypothetical protein